MPTPPPNVPFEVSDEELEAELARFSADAPGAAPAAAAAVPPMAPSRPAAPPPSAVERPISAPSMPAAPRAADDMFSGLDQSPKQSVRPMALGELPQRSSSSAPKYILLFVGVVVVLGGLGFLFWEFAIRRPAAERAANAPQPTAPVVQPTTPSPTVAAPVLPDPSPTVVSDPTLPPQGSNDVPAPLPTPVVTPPAGTNIPPPEQVIPLPQQPVNTTAAVDTDEDGLSDSRELELGTDPRNRDTDADELSDGDEVLKYGTNPLDRDTDKDSFLDGKEVQNGYNPRGSDKCAKPDCSV
ncbi:hypothetical protein KBD61_03535 [Patescibacteria group bacterium]|nr:hypothetical protein [Patescibacteria group bacterium]